MISRKKKWRGDQGLLELRAIAVYIINGKKMVKSRRQKDLRSVDPGDFVLLNSPPPPPLIGGKFSKLLHPLYNPTGPASFFPWGKPMTYALASQWHYCTCSYRGELGCS